MYQVLYEKCVMLNIKKTNDYCNLSDILIKIKKKKREKQKQYPLNHIMSCIIKLLNA